MVDLVVIGSGPTGLYAAYLAGLRNIKTIVLEASLTYGGRLANNYPEKFVFDIAGFEKITASDYIKKLYKQFSLFAADIPIYFNAEVSSIKKAAEGSEVITTTGQKYLTKYVLIAHGGGGLVPIKLSNNRDYENVYYTISDFDAFKSKKVVVLGGGDSALDWANQVLEYTKDVTLVHRRNDFRAQEQSIVEFSKKHGKILTPYVVDEIVGKSKVDSLMLKNVETGQKQALDVDMLVVSYGFIMTQSKLSHWGIKEEKGLVCVNSQMQSNIANIFACGDGASYLGKVKYISVGAGEAITAISAIEDMLFPEKKGNKIHSSSLDLE